MALASAALTPGTRSRRWCIALLLYIVLTSAYAAMLPAELWSRHSPYNHYALQADAWLSGRLDLPGPPPRYTGNNDFALYQGHHYVSFPPVPAALITPLVAASERVEEVRDARFFLWLSALGPALLFLTLEALRREGRARTGERQNALLALLFGLGTVYWFSAAQGTVWFAGHVVSVGFLCGYLLCSVGARRPVAAGLCLALAVGTRPSMALAAPFFLYELWRVEGGGGSSRLGAHPLGWPAQGALLRRLLPFAVPLALVGGLLMAHNQARFGDPFAFGHRHLNVIWRSRIDRWGLFSYHYLGRNLAVMLSGLPFVGPHGVQINGHGLALWLTTPVYAWALWPRRRAPGYAVCALCAGSIALLVLLYQNTGWLQFGYRFSNDFAPFLFLMIVFGGRRLRAGFWALALFCLIVNGFGALTFGKGHYRRYYYIDPSQRILHQPD